MRTMLYRLLIITCIILHTSSVHASSRSKIEVFDASQGTVTQTLPNTDEIQSSVQKTISQLQDLSPRAKIEFDDKEIVYRIPVQPPIDLHGRIIVEIYAVKMSNQQTILICFDNQDHSHVYSFDRIIPLLQKLDQARLSG
jgi:hypothetical protein